MSKKEIIEPFDGLYMGWFTPDELDLVLRALKYFLLRVEGTNLGKQTLVLLEDMTKLKEEGEVNECN